MAVVVMQVQVCEGQIFEYDDVIVVENGGFVVDVK